MGRALISFALSDAGGSKEIADGIAEGLFFNPVITDERKAAALATFSQNNITASADACDACPAQWMPARGARRWSRAGHPLGYPSRACTASCPAPGADAAPCLLLQAGTVYASALSELGLVMGTWRRGADMYTLYLEDAFVSSEWVSGCQVSQWVDRPARGRGGRPNGWAQDPPQSCCCVDACTAGTGSLPS